MSAMSFSRTDCAAAGTERATTASSAVRPRHRRRSSPLRKLYRPRCAPRNGGCERAYATAVPGRRSRSPAAEAADRRQILPGRAARNAGSGRRGRQQGTGVRNAGRGRGRERRERSAARAEDALRRQRLLARRPRLGGSAAAETAAASATAAVGLSLLAVQENGGRTGRDAAARRRAASILDELQGLQAELLGGRADPARLARLAALQDGEEGDRPRTPRGGPRHRPARPHRTRAAGPAPGSGPIRDSCVKAAPDQRLGSFFPWRQPGNACICPRIA